MNKVGLVRKKKDTHKNTSSLAQVSGFLLLIEISEAESLLYQKKRHCVSTIITFIQHQTQHWGRTQVGSGCGGAEERPCPPGNGGDTPKSWLREASAIAFFSEWWTIWLLKESLKTIHIYKNLTLFTDFLIKIPCRNPALWYSGLSHCLWCQHPILDHHFESQLFCFGSSLLLMHLSRHKMTQVLGPQAAPHEKPGQSFRLLPLA